MTLCVPPELPVRIEPVGALDYAALAAAPEPVLVLVRDVAQLAQARAAGLTLGAGPRINVGNVHFVPGRRCVTPRCSSPRRRSAILRELASKGFQVELRAVPAEAPTGMDEIERRYAAAR